MEGLQRRIWNFRRILARLDKQSVAYSSRNVTAEFAELVLGLVTFQVRVYDAVGRVALTVFKTACAWTVSLGPFAFVTLWATKTVPLFTSALS